MENKPNLEAYDEDDGSCLGCLAFLGIFFIISVVFPNAGFPLQCLSTIGVITLLGLRLR